MQTTLSALILEHYESKAGKIWYSITAHDKLVRITVPIAMGDHRFFILLMMDGGSDTTATLGEKILPFISCSDLCERPLALDSLYLDLPPPTASIWLNTTSRPTPLPEMSVTCLAVDSPRRALCHQ